MNPAIAKKGTSFKGVIAYITHDIGADTANRVAFTTTFNLDTENLENAGKVMAWTALHANDLKRAAGFPATGQKTKGTVFHFTLNWEPVADPSFEHMSETARSALEMLGYEEHEAVLAVHTDKDHKHAHIVVNRVHPETGKTHNPHNDHEKLQRWAYQYEKAQGKVICLERAIKYEKDPELKSEYIRRRAEEIALGDTRESKPRPQWEAEQAAPFPVSKLASEIRAEFAEQVKELAQKGRDLASTRSTAWAELKARHQAEREKFYEDRASAFKTRRSFGEAARPVAAYSWDKYQKDREALRESHKGQYQAWKASFKAQMDPAVREFMERQKTAWKSFYKLQGADKRGKLEKALAEVAGLSVRHQTREHRGHLQRLFNSYATPDKRLARFKEAMDHEKAEFFRDLKARETSYLAQVKEQHRAELQALRQRFETSRAQQKAGSDAVKEAKARDKAARDALYTRQKHERDALGQSQNAASAALQGEWSRLNTERKAAWDAYKQHRAGQGQEEGQEASQNSKPRSDLYSARESFARAREGKSRDYAGGKESSQGAGSPGGRQITRKGPG